MNVYQRPLFRQMGGPVAPQPAPQPAMGGQDQMAMIQAAEQMATEQTQGLGAQYAQQTMANLDAAETPEQVINAIRGNQLPLEQRYQELAEYVGEEDAGQTPQSVLALVQPTLMMTEEGAMGSGIGELMRNITGEVDMLTEQGVPTDMGQGVGSLMMAGVGQQPVANFSQGGFVQRFQTGGEASRLQQLYSEMLPVYQSIMGDGEEARRLTQSQILFDIADRAAAFAGGVDPRTGQSVARLSPAAQLGAAMTGLGGTIGQRLAGQEEQDRALKLAALQAAQGEYSAERAAARAAGGDRALGNMYDVIVDGEVVTSLPLATQSDYAAVQEQYPGATIRPSRVTEPNIREFNNNLVDVSDPANPRIILEGVADRDIREVGGMLLDITDPLAPQIVFQGEVDRDIREVGSNLVDITDPASPRIVYQGENERDLRTVGDSVVDFTDPTNPQVVYTGPSEPEFRTVGDVLLNVSDPENPQVVYEGAQERDIRVVDNRVIDFSDPTNPVTLYEPEPAAPSGNFVNVQTADGQTISLREDDPRLDEVVAAGGRVVSRTGPTVADPLVDPTVMGRYASGETSAQEEATIQAAIAEQTRPMWNPQTNSFEPPAITPLVRQAEEARNASGMSTVMSFPTEAAPSEAGAERDRNLAELGGSAFGTRGFLAELANTAFALVDAEAPFSEAQQAVDAVNALNQDALIAFRSLLVGRPAQDAVNQFATLLPNPATITGSPSSAASEVQQIISLYRSNIAAAEDMLAGGTLTQTEQNTLRRSIVDAQRMIDSYDALLMGIRQGPNAGAGAPDPASFRRPG